MKIPKTFVCGESRLGTKTVAFLQAALAFSPQLPEGRLKGFRDYRGVPVVGTWAWDEERRIALAAEMEMSEAYAPVRTIRALSAVMMAVVTTVLIILMRAVAHRARLQATNFGYQQALKAQQDFLAIVVDTSEATHSATAHRSGKYGMRRISGGYTQQA
jgi:hypothetical protein